MDGIISNVLIGFPLFECQRGKVEEKKRSGGKKVDSREEKCYLNTKAKQMARFCFSTTGNATTYPNRANILSRSEKNWKN